MKIIAASLLALTLVGCGADIAVRPTLGVSVGPAYPAYYGGGGYGYGYGYLSSSLAP
jgi:hypothetical protein